MNTYKAGSIKKHAQNQPHQYEYFSPSFINKPFEIENKKILLALEQANRLLGELNAYGNLIPDVDFFIKMHVVSEAVSSSKIEGTKTEMDDALLSEEEVDPEKRDDWQEVNNYINAMNEAVANLRQLPVSVRLIKETHKVLMSGVRGENKIPGEIRTSQNWIGGASINTAHFVPPHHEEVSELLSDWEKFWHNQDIDVPVLIKVAMCHYQFETIHPFLDGNGRIGRLLMILQLMERDFLRYPVLYISNFFEHHRQAYYDSLDIVRSKNDIDQWILLFLEAISETAKKSIKTFESILKLRASFEKKILGLGRKAKRGQTLLESLFTDPIVTVSEIQKKLTINYATANSIINDFVELGILREKTGFSRNRIFVMDDYVKLFRK
jgi:Fic family protein